MDAVVSSNINEMHEVGLGVDMSEVSAENSTLSSASDSMIVSIRAT
jgi:hypothetical protein